MQSSTTSAPAKLNLSENGTAESKPPQPTNETYKFVEANATLAVWVIFLFIGGGILALYYAHIGYIPDMEWKASLVYLFICSIIGGVIGLLLTMSLYLPGLIWSETLVLDPCLKFSYPSPMGQTTELCLLTIFGYLGLPFLLVLVISHIALLIGKVWYWPIAGVLLVLTFFVIKSLLKHRVRAEAEGYIGQGPLSDVWSDLQSDSFRLKTKVRNVFLRLLKKPKLREELKISSDLQRHVFKLAAAFTLSVLLNQISMYLIYWLAGRPSAPKTFIPLLIICTAGVWITCHVVAFRHRDYPRQAVAASLVAVGLLLFTADNFSWLSVKLMNHFGIGYYRRFNVMVSDDGMKIVNGLGVPTCGDPQQLCNVEILSKMGDHYYLRVGDTCYVTLPKPDVVAVRSLN